MPKCQKQLLPTVARTAGRRLEIAPRRIADLKSNPSNPRNHSARQIRQIAQSIKTFGFNVPVLVDAKGNVIAGHGRIRACQLLGWTEVPTICLEHLSEAEARAFMIADNRLTENSDWNEQLLAEQLRDLSLLDLNFSLETTGFDMGEIDLRIEGLNLPTQDDPADDLSQVPSGPPITRPGDTWELGEHRVHCGNALAAVDYAALLQGEQAQMVFSDPPYNVRIDGNVGGLGRKRHREFVMASGEMSEFEFARFLVAAISLFARHSAEGSLHYLCMDWRHIAQLLTAARGVYRQLINICVWVKDNAGMGSFYRSQHEFVCVFRHGRGAHRNNVQLGRYGRNRSNIWHYPVANSFSRAGDEGNLLAMHPTVKPVALVADAIMDCTSRHDLVLDGFLGSGTTVIAAARTGRRCYGLEVDPLYVDVIVRRWQGFTRDTARNAMTGRSFREVEAEAQEQGWGANEPATTK
jgi:DNA modification methylase